MFNNPTKSTELAERYLFALKIIAGIQFIIIILNLANINSLLSLAIINFILLMFLIYSIIKMSSSFLAFYCIFALYLVINYLVIIFTPVQLQTNFQTINIFYYSTAVISSVFYLFSGIFCFFPYRQFKAIEYNDPNNLINIEMKDINNESNRNNQIHYEQDNKRNKITAQNGSQGYFTGNPIKIG